MTVKVDFNALDSKTILLDSDELLVVDKVTGEPQKLSVGVVNNKYLLLSTASTGVDGNVPVHSHPDLITNNGHSYSTHEEVDYLFVTSFKDSSNGVMVGYEMGNPVDPSKIIRFKVDNVWTTFTTDSEYSF